MKKLFFKNEQGYSMLIAVFALVLLSVLGLSIFTVSGNTLKTSSNERLDQAVYYIAEAALVEKRAELINVIKNIQNRYQEGNPIKDNKIADELSKIKVELSDQLENNEIQFTSNIDGFSETHENKIPGAYYTIKDVSENNEIIIYEIKSIGKIDNKTRKVSQKIEIDPNCIIDKSQCKGNKNIITNPPLPIPISKPIIIANGSSNPHPRHTKVDEDYVDSAKEWLEFANENNFTIIDGNLEIKNKDSGKYFVSQGNKSEITINANAKFNGIIIAPYSNIKINGNSNFCGTIIANGFSNSGGGNARFCSNLNSSDGIPWTLKPIVETNS